MLIYGLTDIHGRVRYVGFTTKTAEERRCAHINRAPRKKSPVYSWIRGLLGRDEEPGVIVLQKNLSDANWADAERRWIRYFGPTLLNLTAGGLGTPHHKHTDETKAKLRERALGRKLGSQTESHRAKISAARKAWWESLDAEQRLALKRGPETELQKLRKSIAKKAWWESLNAEQRLALGKRMSDGKRSKRTPSLGS